MRGGIDGALQLGYQFRNGAVQVVSNVANGSPIMWLPRKNLRHSREMTRVCSRNLTQRPAFGGDDNAFPTCGLRIKVRRFWWVTLSEHKWVILGERRGKNPNSLKQHGRGDVVGMGDKRDRHPAADGLIFRADLPRVLVGPVGEDESTGDRQQEGEANSHSAPPRFSHDSI
jgi:hypothetical protein